MRNKKILRIILILLLLFISNNRNFSKMTAHHDLIIDSKMTLEEAIKGTKAPQEVIDSLVLLDVIYYSTDSKYHQGQIVINKTVKNDVKRFFQIALKNKFPIKQVKPIVLYNWNDDSSMADNNSSAFNYRFIDGTQKLSNHSFGRAIDINPYFNPVYYADGRIEPKGAKRDITKHGVFIKQNELVRYMLSKGWRWGGNWETLKDWHHFDKAGK